MQKEKRVERIMRKVDHVMENPSRYKNPGLIISGLQILALQVEMSE